MIYINLLPPDEFKRVTFSQKRTAVIPLLFILFFSLLLLWIGFIFSISHLKMLAYTNIATLEKIKPRKATIDILWQELHNELIVKKGCIETMMICKLEWAEVLNVISDFTTQGIWLSRLDLTNKDNAWLLTIGGFAKEVTDRSMIKDIGSFVTGVKNHLEASLMKRVEEASELKDFIEVSTVTKRKRAYKTELTEFITTFKIKI
ncbi:MAG: hypothetical protein KKH94_10380 [Candidatus Omnitrophica bacterium]|nr:hypothetical protein [Candidatus Omnitrophota bacterium]